MQPSSNSNHDSNPNYEVLYHKGHNKIIYCHECRAFHINFEMISMDLVKASLDGFMAALHSYIQEYEGRVDPTNRCIRICTPYQGFRLMLSIEDMRQFGNVLYEARCVYDEWVQRSNRRLF